MRRGSLNTMPFQLSAARNIQHKRSSLERGLLSRRGFRIVDKLQEFFVFDTPKAFPHIPGDLSTSPRSNRRLL